MAGQPKIFKSGEELDELHVKFCDSIKDGGYTIAPTNTEFSCWLTRHYKPCDRRTIYNALHKYFPAIKESVDARRADVIAQGAMLGKYQPSMSIFALKNWCGWTDKQENNITASIAMTVEDKALLEKAAKLL